MSSFLEEIISPMQDHVFQNRMKDNWFSSYAFMLTATVSHCHAKPPNYQTSSYQANTLVKQQGFGKITTYFYAMEHFRENK